MCCFTGGSSWAGRNQPGSVGPLPRVSASPEEKAGRRVLVEAPEAEAKMADVYEKGRGRGERWTGHAVVATAFPLLQVLEGDEVSYASKGQESSVSGENRPAESMMGLSYIMVPMFDQRVSALMQMCMEVNPLIQTIEILCCYQKLGGTVKGYTTGAPNDNVR